MAILMREAGTSIDFFNGRLIYFHSAIKPDNKLARKLRKIKMTFLTRPELRFTYSWNAKEGDNPRIIGEEDRRLFNRDEGYEVLTLIDEVAQDNKWKHKASGSKLEWLIHEHLPGDIRGRKNVRVWIASHWDSHNTGWGKFDSDWKKKKQEKP